MFVQSDAVVSLMSGALCDLSLEFFHMEITLRPFGEKWVYIGDPFRAATIKCTPNFDVAYDNTIEESSFVDA